MSIKTWLASAPLATYGLFQLHKDTVKNLTPADKGEYPLSGVTAVVESGEALSQRVTLTRFAAFGLFALAMKKKKGGTSFLLIEGPDFAWTVEVKRGDQAKAQAFAAKVRTAAKMEAER